MSDPIQWGILGAAKFARQYMGPAIHAAAGARLAALATSSVDKAQPFLEFQPDLRVHTSYDALLADPQIDAVYIPLPNHLHVEWALKALHAGKHVLVEKPATMQENEFEKLIAARDASGRLCAEAYMIVHHPQWQRARELYLGGAIGKLRHVSAAFTFDNRSEPDNIRNKAETGGGSLRDIGVYVFGSTRFVTGEEPVALDAQVTFENGIDVVAHVQAEFPSFTYGGYTSIRMHPRQEMVFHGEKAVMRLTAPFNASVFGEARVYVEGAPDVPTTIERFPGVNHYVHQVQNFGRAIREGSAYECPLEFSRGTQRMMDMVFSAAGKV